MPRFFCETIAGGKARLSGEDAAHVARSLRMGPGEALTLCDGQGTDFFCRIDYAAPEEVLLTVLESRPSVAEPPVFIRLYMALPKAEKFEWVVQKSVELGVGEIVPVLSRRCVSRPDPKSFAKKLQRYNRIAAEAAKQSGRGRIPEVRELLSFEAAIREMAARPSPMLFYERATAPMRETLAAIAGEASVLIGAEGGFDEEEVAAAAVLGIPSLTLGPRILRCETAPLAALTAIQYETGGLDTPGKEMSE